MHLYYVFIYPAQEQRDYPPTPAAEHWAEWCSFIKDNDSQWNNALKRTSRHSCLQRTKLHEWEQLHLELLQDAEDAVQLPKEPTPERQAVTQSAHACYKCKKAFTTKASWAVHAFKIHQRTTDARRVASGTSCERCQKEYHEHVRLIRHLTHSKICREALQQRGEQPQLQRGMNSAAEIKERLSRHVRPVLRQQGPRPQYTAVMLTQRLPQRLTNCELTLTEQLVDAVDKEWQTQPELEQALRHAISTTTLHPAELPEFLKRWWHEVQLQEILAYDQMVEQAIDAVASSCDAQAIFPQENWYAGAEQQHPRTDIKTRTQRLHDHFAATKFAPQQVLRSKEVVLLHLFSGRRRNQDIQSYAEKGYLHRTLPGLPTAVL